MQPTLRLTGPRPACADGRFAPSPSGVLHLGNLRTALVAWAIARAQNAAFRLRIDDLDPGRSRRVVADGQLRDLRDIGIDWDGPLIRQSERSAAYAGAERDLDAAGLLYRCWCTRAEIRDAVRAPHGPQHDGYPGTCSRLTAAQVAERESRGRPPALRVRASGAGASFTDRIAGAVSAPVDDFVVRRGDGAYAYNLAVVIDDHEQRIGEVVRGADLLDTTPRQVWLHERLGLPVPSYAHVPLLLGDDGERLAKRHGALTLAERVAGGESPGAVRAALAAQLGIGGPGADDDPQVLVTAVRALLERAA